jgi:hypothetical protein
VLGVGTGHIPQAPAGGRDDVRYGLERLVSAVRARHNGYLSEFGSALRVAGRPPRRSKHI